MWKKTLQSKLWIWLLLCTMRDCCVFLICSWWERNQREAKTYLKITRQKMRFFLVSELYSSWEIIFNKLVLSSTPKQSSKQSLVGQLVKNPSVGDLGSIPGLGRFPGEGKGYPLQYSGLENSMDCTAQGVTKNQTWLSYFHFKQSAAAKHITNMWKRNVCLNKEGQIFE